MGRPSDYAPDVGVAICVRLVEGESLRSICRDEDMPGLSTVYQWFAAHPAFAEQYARAREDQADTLADEILDIADDSRNDWVEKQNKDGSTYLAVDQEHINRSRLRVDTRKWIASKLKAKKYGDKVETTHRGDSQSPIVISSVDAKL